MKLSWKSTQINSMNLHNYKFGFIGKERSKQGIIKFCRKGQCSLTNLDHSPSLVNKVKLTSKFEQKTMQTMPSLMAFTRPKVQPKAVAAKFDLNHLVFNAQNQMKNPSL